MLVINRSHWGLVLLEFYVDCWHVWVPKSIFSHRNNRPRPVALIDAFQFLLRHIEASVFCFFIFQVYFDRLARVEWSASQDRVLFLFHALSITGGHLNLRRWVLSFLRFGLQKIHCVLLKLLCCVVMSILNLIYISIYWNVLSPPLVS